jgi:hypothetical protein
MKKRGIILILAAGLVFCAALYFKMPAAWEQVDPPLSRADVHRLLGDPASDKSNRTPRKDSWWDDKLIGHWRLDVSFAADGSILSKKRSWEWDF